MCRQGVKLPSKLPRIQMSIVRQESLSECCTFCLAFKEIKISYHSLHSATSKAVVEESSKLAECVGKTRSLLKKILSEGMDNCLTKLDNDPQGYLSQPLILLEAVLQECHNTFTACFHSFYPTPALQWACLCDLLNCLDQVVFWNMYIQEKPVLYIFFCLWVFFFFGRLRVGYPLQPL